MAYANEREVFGRPIGQNQGVGFPIARAHAETEAADLMTRKAAAMFDQQMDCGAEANTAKLLASEASWKAAEACFQTLGGFAFATEYDVGAEVAGDPPVSDGSDFNQHGSQLPGAARSEVAAELLGMACGFARHS